MPYIYNTPEDQRAMLETYLADAAVREADGQQTGVLRRETGDKETLGHRCDFDRPIVGESEQAIARMPAGVEDFASAHPGEVVSAASKTTAPWSSRC